MDLTWFIALTRQTVRMERTRQGMSLRVTLKSHRIRENIKLFPSFFCLFFQDDLYSHRLREKWRSGSNPWLLITGE